MMLPAMLKIHQPLFIVGCIPFLVACAATPDVVWLLADQWRHDWTSFGLEGLETPVFRYIAEQGTRFTRAVVPSPLSNPSRASLATGLKYSRHGVVDTGKRHELHVDLPTIYQQLRDAGVWTLDVGQDDLTMLGAMSGRPCELEGKAKCGSRHARQLGFEDHARCYGKDFAPHAKHAYDPYTEDLEAKGLLPLYRRDFDSCVQSSTIRTHGYLCPNASRLPQREFLDDWIARQATALIRRAPRDKPMFLQVNYAGPHPPFVVTPGMRSMVDRGVPWPLAHNSSGLDNASQQLIRANYAAGVQHVDTLNRQVLAALWQRGRWNETYICISSDHGEMLGDFWDNSPYFESLGKHSPWQAAVSVPLACMGPGVPAGRVVEDPVGTIDLAATALELQNASAPAGIDSVSLVGMLHGGEPDGRPAVSTLMMPAHSFSTAQQRLADGHVYKFVCCMGVCPFGGDVRDGAVLPSKHKWVRLLFDLTTDPLETADVSEAHPVFAAELAAALELPFRGCGLDAEGQSQAGPAGAAAPAIVAPAGGRGAFAAPAVAGPRNVSGAARGFAGAGARGARGARGAHSASSAGSADAGAGSASVATSAPAPNSGRSAPATTAAPAASAGSGTASTRAPAAARGGDSSAAPGGAAPEGAAAPKDPVAPDFVLLIADQWRHDWTSFDLPALETPLFRYIAEKGTRFARAVVPSPLCNPSRASLATGLRYTRHGITGSKKTNELSPKLATIYQQLRGAGVWTLDVGKDDLTLLGRWRGKPCAAATTPRCGAKRSRQLGFADYARCYGKDFAPYARKALDPYMDELERMGLLGLYRGESFLCPASSGVQSTGYLCPNATRLPQRKFIDDWIAQRAVDLVKRAPSDKPLFLQVNYAGPHPPFIVTGDMRKGVAERAPWPLAYNSTRLDAESQQLMRANYAAGVEHIDKLNRAVLDAIADRGRWNDTYICVLSDHGEMLGDFWDISPSFEPLGKNSPWQASIAVPLACMGPGVPAGRVVEEPVSTIDLAATAMDLQGASAPAGIDSVSMRGVLHGGSHDGRPAVSTLMEENHTFSTAQKRFGDGRVYKLVCCIGTCPFGRDLRLGAAVPQTGWVRNLYDITSDRLEMTDIRAHHPEVAAELAAALEPPFRGCGLDISGHRDEVHVDRTIDLPEQDTPHRPLAWRVLATQRLFSSTLAPAGSQHFVAATILFSAVLYTLLAGWSMRRRRWLTWMQVQRQDEARELLAPGRVSHGVTESGDGPAAGEVQHLA